MSFEICLIYYVETISVTQLINVGVVRVMTCPYGVEVEGFDHADIPFHLLPSDSLATVFAVVVAIDPVKFDWHTVHQHSLAIDPYIPESDLATACFNKIV